MLMARAAEAIKGLSLDESLDKSLQSIVPLP